MCIDGLAACSRAWTLSSLLSISLPTWSCLYIFVFVFVCICICRLNGWEGGDIGCELSPNCLLSNSSQLPVLPTCTLHLDPPMCCGHIDILWQFLSKKNAVFKSEHFAQHLLAASTHLVVVQSTWTHPCGHIDMVYGENQFLCEHFAQHLEGEFFWRCFARTLLRCPLQCCNGWCYLFPVTPTNPPAMPQKMRHVSGWIKVRVQPGCNMFKIFRLRRSCKGTRNSSYHPDLWDQLIHCNNGSSRGWAEFWSWFPF